MKIKLSWDGPYSPYSFLEHPNPHPYAGVYIWSADFADGYWIEYVGKAGGKPTIGIRQQQHVANTIGLRYTIPAQVRECGVKWEPDEYPDNIQTLLDEPSRSTLIREAIAYLDSMEFYVAEMQDYDSNIIKVVERNLLWTLQPRSTQPGTKTSPPIPVGIIHENPKWLRKNRENQFKLEPEVV